MDESFQNNKIHLAGIAGFGLTSVFAVKDHWSLQEFCWSTWLGALFFCWTCIILGSIQIILNAQSEKKTLEQKFGFLGDIPDNLFAPLLSIVVLLIAWIIFNLYCYVFGIYGILLSVFAEMQPHTFFGRNGFINSDFFTPIISLTEKFWPMFVSLILSNFQLFLKNPAWKLIILPFKSKDIIRIHVMVIAMPFLSLLAFAFFHKQYQPITIILLMGILYLVKPSQNT